MSGTGGPRLRRVGALLSLAIALGLAAGGGTALGVAPGTVNLQLLSFNDYHGHLQPPTGADGLLVTAAGQPQPSTAPAGGVEYLTTHLKRLREGHPQSLTVAAGDLIGGSPVPVGPLQGRAQRREPEHARPRSQRRRQPRVRRGRSRVAAHAVRRLPPGRWLLRRRRVLRRPLPVPRRQRRLQGRRDRDPTGGRPAVRRLVEGAPRRPHRAAADGDPDRGRREGRLHRDDPGEHADAGRPGGHPRRGLPRRDRHREPGGPGPAQARREGHRRAAARGRPASVRGALRLRLQRGRRRWASPVRSWRSPRASRRRSTCSSPDTPISRTPATSRTRPGATAGSRARPRSAASSPTPS